MPWAASTDFDIERFLSKSAHAEPCAGEGPEPLPGGVPRGKLAELVAPGAGAGLFVEQLLRGERERQSFVALVDATNAFDPATLEDASLMDHLLWVRCNGLKQALRCADVLLRDENFPTVLMDLLDVPLRELKRVPLQHWYRLQGLCRTGNSGLLLTRQSCVSAAQFRMRIEGDYSLAALDSPRTALHAILEHEVIKQAADRSGLRLVTARELTA